MQKPTLEQIEKLITQIAKLLDEAEIDYLLYGSLGYWLLTKQATLINDIDIIVSKKDFGKIVDAINKLDLEINPIVSENAIHANHLKLIGNDNKPFDISFDSYEHYFKHLGIDLNNYLDFAMKDAKLKLIAKQDLIKIYEIGVKSNNIEKSDGYKEKLKVLLNLKNNNY